MKVIFIQRCSIYSIYSNYIRFYKGQYNSNVEEVKEAVYCHKESLKYMHEFKNKLDVPFIDIYYEALVNNAHVELQTVSKYLNLDKDWSKVLAANPPKDKNDFRFLRDTQFVSTMQKVIK